MFVLKFADNINNLLCPADSERGDKHYGVSADCVINYPGERDLRVFGIMQSVSVSRFHQQIVAWGWRLGITNDWLVIVSQITREEDSPCLSTCPRIRNLDQNETGAKNMA